MTFEQLKQSKIDRIASLGELRLNENILLKRGRGTSTTYRGGTFEGSGFHLHFDKFKKRPVMLVCHGKSFNRFTCDEIASTIRFLEIKLGLTNPLTSSVDLAIDIAHLQITEQIAKRFSSPLKGSCLFKDDAGKLRTLYFGKRGGTQVKVYDKRQELWENSKLTVTEAYPELAPEDALTRTEVTLSRDYLRGRDLNIPSEIIAHAPVLMKMAMTNLIIWRGRNGKPSRQWIEWREALTTAPPLKRCTPNAQFDEQHALKTIIGSLAKVAVYKGFHTLQQTFEFLASWPSLKNCWEIGLSKNTKGLRSLS